MIPIIALAFILSACKVCTSNAMHGSSQQTQPRKEAKAQSLPTKLEIPLIKKNKGDFQLIEHTGYTTCYNLDWLIPNWVAYDLTTEERQGTVPRPKRPFEPDPLVKGRSAEHRDYTNSGYSRGHMAPAADMKWSEVAINESFYLSNICPQKAELNSGVWERLEQRVRALAAEETVYICCGPIMSDNPQRIGANGVAVPDGFFKVLCMQRKGRWQAIGFIFPNEGCKGSMFDFAYSVDEVETATGYDFFPTLPDDVETAIEAAFTMKDWQ